MDKMSHKMIYRFAKEKNIGFYLTLNSHSKRRFDLIEETKNNKNNNKEVIFCSILINCINQMKQ